MEPHYDAVCILLETPFCEWKEKDKQWIIKNGRPTPSFEKRLIITESTDSVSNFQASWYELLPWLCGSSYMRKLFCWPCLIHGIENCENDSFSFDNVTEQILSSHEATFSHLKNALRLKELSKVFQGPDFHKNISLDLVEHNKNALLNRHLMQLLLKAIVFFTKRQLPVNGREETVSNKCTLKELFNLFVKESSLELQQQYSNVRTYFESESVQNDLIHCICSHINNFVKKDVSESPFYSIELDRVNQSHCIITVRYVTSNGLVVERPLDFLYVNKSCSTEEFFEQLQAILDPLDYQSKLIAQSYDGASILTENLKELRKKINLQAIQALFIHSCNHKFDEIIVQSVSNIPECQSYFSKLYGISRFFNSSTKRLKALNLAIADSQIIIERDQLSTGCEIISAVNKFFSAFKITFKNIVSDPSFDSASIRQANTFLSCFKDMEYTFLTLVFNFVCEVIEGLFDVLQLQSLDMSFILDEIDNIQTKLAYHCTSYEFSYLYRYSKVMAENVSDHKECYDREDVQEKFRQLYLRILETIIHELDERFKDSENLQFMCLAEWSNFRSFSECLPDIYIEPLYVYPNVMTDIDRLENELKLFYSVIPYKEYNIQEVIAKLKEDGSCEVFKEVYKLFSLIITLPCVNVPASKYVFSPGRIQSYLKKFYQSERLRDEFQASHIMLSIGQEVIDHLIKTSMFYDDIIDRLVSLKGQMIPLMLQR